VTLAGRDGAGDPLVLYGLFLFFFFCSSLYILFCHDEYRNPARAVPDMFDFLSLIFYTFFFLLCAKHDACHCTHI
jgi:hypothetical protein